MLPRNPNFTGHTWLAGFDAKPKKYRSVSVPIIMDGRSLTAPMAVVPRETLRGNSALLGRNIPGLSVQQVLCPTPIDDSQQQSQPTSGDSQPVLAVQTRAQKAKEDQRRAQEDKESEVSDIPVTNFSLDVTADTSSQQEQSSAELPEDLEDTVEHDEDVSDCSSEIFMEEDDTDPLPLEYPHQEPAVPKMPLGADAFSKEQKEDSNLATLWEQARNNPGQYKILNGLLYRSAKDELEQPRDLLVVPLDIDKNCLGASSLLSLGRIPWTQESQTEVSQVLLLAWDDG